MKKNDADSALRNAGNEVSSESIGMYFKANFYAWPVRSLYTFLYWVSIFGLRTFYLGIKCHLAPFTVLFTNYFIFGGK